jgi:threonylcarbamoyladenosine tRNA methylthiotransferase MtaB
MRRRYTAGIYSETVARLRGAAPEIAVTTDVIVGFPGETEAQFEETARFVEELSLAQVHVFPYSERPGTAAARLDGRVPLRERERRCALMLEVAARCASRHRSGLVGKVRDVLFEEPADPDGKAWRGITDDYVRVIASGDRIARNSVVPMRIVSVADGAVVGEAL